MLAEQTPAIVHRVRPACPRRRRLHADARSASAAPPSSTRWAGAGPSIHVTPATTDLTTAQRWFSEFEGAGLDGVVAKPLTIPYQPEKRIMFKIKHERTADCVVAGYRLHKSGADAVGSLMLGLYKDDGTLASVGVIGAFPMTKPAATSHRTAAARHHLRRTSVELGGPRGRRPTPSRNRRLPLECGQGPVVRSIAARAGGRGPLRPHGRRKVPPHSTIQSLAARPRPTLVHVHTT